MLQKAFDHHAQDLLSRLGLRFSETDQEGDTLQDGASLQGVCERHGAFALSVQDAQGVMRYRPNVCPVCRAERLSAQLMCSAAIPMRHQDCRFETFEARTEAQKAVLAACQNYAEGLRKHTSQGACLILSGNPGTGKNHLATAIARVALEAGLSVVQTTPREMVLQIRETWGRGPSDPESRRSERGIINGFAGADLLILDEVGKQFGGKGDEVHFFEVINRRYLDMKPTVVLSNETVENIEVYLGAAAFDRLCENGMLLRLDWQSYRRGRV